MKIGLIGSGKIVEELMTVREANQKLQNSFDTACVWGRNPEKLDILCNRFNLPGYTTNYSELLQSDIDTVYIALPNHLHFQFAEEALQNGKHVILEKPFTMNEKEGKHLFELADQYGLFLYEAMTSQYLEPFEIFEDHLPDLGPIRLIQANYSQYSSRYDAFLAGENPNAFNPEYGGGALRDLNYYNLHFLISLFGLPENVQYFSNLQRGIDISGIVHLDYHNFKASLSAAKDSFSPGYFMIQGEKGCLCLESSANQPGSVSIYQPTGKKTQLYTGSQESRLLKTFLSLTSETFFDRKHYQDQKAKTLMTLNLLDKITSKEDQSVYNEADPQN